MYLLKLSTKPWRKNPWHQLLTSVSVGFLLFSCGILLWIEQGLHPLLYRMKSEQVITAYLNPPVEKAKGEKLLDTVRLLVGARPAEIEWVSSEEFLKRLKNHYPDLGKELENLDSEKELLLPQYLSISGVLPEPVLEKIKKIPGIESADSSVDRYPHILNAFETLKKMTQVLLLGLSLALLILLTQLAQLNATTQQESLSLLKLMGAGTFSQRFPPLLSGLWTGLLGGLIAAMGWWLSGTLLIDRFQLLSPGLKQMPQPPWEMGVILLGVGMVFGIFSGLFSGAFAQSK